MSTPRTLKRALERLQFRHHCERRRLEVVYAEPLLAGARARELAEQRLRVRLTPGVELQSLEDLLR